MIQETELSPEAQKAINLAEKMLRLAAKNPNEHERKAAEDKAAQIMLDFNLDMATVEAHAEGTSGKRMEENLKGGFYKYQRDLWGSVAELNFCKYWNQIVTISEKKFLPNPQKNGFRRHIVTRLEKQHRVVGRRVNVVATKAMATYLEEAIERLTRERVQEEDQHFRGQWANSFREGASRQIIERIYAKRRKMLSEERQAAEERAKAGAADIRDGVSTGRRITLSTYTDAESDANMDFAMGEDGWSARQRKEDAERIQARAEKRRRLEAEWTAWCEANPKEAAKMARQEEARQRRNAERRTGYGSRSYRGSRDTYKGDRSAFASGYESAATISIDQQMGAAKPAAFLR